MTQNAELHAGGVHDDVTECHADHVVVVDGADVDAVQVGQCHHQLLPAHRAAIGVLPVILKQQQAGFLMYVHLHLCLIGDILALHFYIIYII